MTYSKKIPRNVMRVFCMYCGKPFLKNARPAKRKRGLAIRPVNTRVCNKRCSSYIKEIEQHPNSPKALKLIEQMRFVKQW